MEPSKYQSAIYAEYDDWTSNRNIFVTAGPGSGKSFTLLQLLKRTPINKKVIMTAFNVSIAKELSNKVPMRPGVKVATIHSTGFEVMRKNLYGKFKVMQEEGIKTYILAKDIIENPFKQFKNSGKKYAMYLFTIAKLYNLYRLNLSEKTEESLGKLADDYSVELIGENPLSDTIRVIDKLDDYNVRPHKETMIDFTDMLWFSYKYVNGEFFPKYDVVFVDEVQDLCPLQREMILRLRSSRGRFVVVGDEKQAIYSFMGSNLDSLKSFQNMDNTVSLPLSISYRFGKNIADFANTIFPGSVEGYDMNPVGVIRNGTLDEAQAGDFVICRNNLPLVESFLDMISMNKSSYIMGRDFGKELCNILDRVESLSELDDLLQKKYDELIERGVSKPFENKSYVALDEKVRIIRFVAIRKRYDIDELKAMFSELFTDRKNRDMITLSTIHKSKGLEADRVFWLAPELIPSKYARTELEMYQETCLKFVIITRAKKELIIVPGNMSL
jgi:DNA helicase II / ATP-dependent DNA helicase PcrA